MFYLSERSKSRLEGVDFRLIEIVEECLKISKIDFGIPKYGGLRTEEEQLALFLDGKSKCDGVNIKSNHQSGKAIDFFGYVDGAATWDEYTLTHIGSAMLQAAHNLGYRISWGGLWSNFVDMPHIELLES